jgi:hypothetical protein
MKTAATTDKITAIDSKKPLTKQELITANIKLLIEQSEARKERSTHHGHEPLPGRANIMMKFHWSSSRKST